ncbi:cytochrome P450 2J4-like [Amphibalanus amphitrite]|uniref:cytochrome P450 2J4-like n=1 Tax=Amphibalanus amphitrite TaxID=1232801 RepID=UPI001C90476B|nr:cytochrome P450 2J4-like [Amphibalanus amphitrite]
MFAIALLAIIVALYLLKRIVSYRGNLPPGPVSIPLLGSWEFIQLCWTGGRLEDLCRRLGAKYGPIVFFRIALDTPVVVIRTYDALKEAAKDVRLHGMTGTYLNRLAGHWDNLGVSLADGSKWQHNRKFIIRTLGRLGFNRNKLETLASAECSKLVEDLVELKGQVVNIERDLTGAIANVTLKFIMNFEFESHDPRIGELKEASFHIVRLLANIQSHLDFFPWLAHFSSERSDVKTLARSLDKVSDFIKARIDEHIETLDEAHPRDFIDEYLLQTPKADHDTSIENLLVMLKDLLLGSLEPPPIALSWTILLLAKHPEVQERVRAELTELLGDHRAPTVEDERQCPYTQATIEETLRFVTLTPINRHSTTQGATSLRGYHIPAGAMVLADQHSLHHDPAVWGDPDVFRPDRFLGEDGAKLREQVRAFGFGPRVCLAEAHARSLLFAFLAGLLRRIEFRLPQKGQVATMPVYQVLSRPSETLVVPFPR